MWRIDRPYREAKGGLEAAAQAARSILFLETAAQSNAPTSRSR
jgi:hypothetical protein